MSARFLNTERDLDRLLDEVVSPLYDPLEQADPKEFGSFLLGLYKVDDFDSPNFVSEAMSDAYTSLPFTKKNLLDIASELELEDEARASLSEVDQQTEAHVDELFATLPEEVKPGREFIAVCMSLEMEAHANEGRVSGRPYDMHPLEAAAILHHVLQTLRSQGHEIDETTEDLVIGAALVHDIAEAAIQKEGMYFDLSRNRNYHPLLIKRIIERIEGPIAERAMEGAMVLEHLTHVKSRPWMREYKGDYIQARVCVMPAAIMPKMSEMHGNILEPRPDKPINLKYTDSMQMMETALVAHLEPQNQSWGHDFAAVLRTIKKEDLPSLVHNLRDYTYDLSNYIDDVAA